MPSCRLWVDLRGIAHAISRSGGTPPPRVRRRMRARGGVLISCIAAIDPRMPTITTPGFTAGQADAACTTNEAP